MTVEASLNPFPLKPVPRLAWASLKTRSISCCLYQLGHVQRATISGHAPSKTKTTKSQMAPLNGNESFLESKLASGALTRIKDLDHRAPLP